jgi:hypothetical protein
MVNAVQERAMLYFTKWDFCPVGCGMGVVFLKSIESGRIFLHCTSCGLAWDKPPTPHVVEALDPPECFAPKGIAFPSRAEIEAAGFGHYIEEERREQDCIDDLWRLRAKTFIESGDYARAITVLTGVINTWYRPPSVAFHLRAVAYRCMGDFQRAAEDEKVAEHLSR